MKSKKIITICSSLSFYKDVIDIEKELKKMGFKVKIPTVARKMAKSEDFDVDKYKTWFKNPNDYKKKTKLMKGHFKKVVESDAILVVNNKKRGILGYIGGNVLMEMCLAFHYKKHIYILNKVGKKQPFIEEILGLNPVLLNGDFRKIKK